MSPSELRQLADETEKRAATIDAETERRYHAGKREVALLNEQVVILRRMATEAERAGLSDAGDVHSQEALHKRSQKSRVNAMEAVHRIAISQAAAPRDAFLKAIRKAGYTLHTLAKAVGVKGPTLHAHRRPKGSANSRPIPQSRADSVEKLTGWKAVAQNWPAGIS